MSSIATGTGYVQHDPSSGKVTIIRSDNRTGLFVHLALSQREVDALKQVLT